MFAFAGQIFQFFARPGNVNNYGFNFTLRHPLSLWKAQNDIFENLVLWLKCIGPKLFQAEMCLGPKYAWGQTGCEPYVGTYSSLCISNDNKS